MVKARAQLFKTKFTYYSHVIGREAAELLRRRKLSYAVLALTLTAGSLYFSGVRPALATSGGPAPAPASDEGRTRTNQPQLLQTVTGQSADNASSDNNTSSQGSASNQSHTSVTVNGTDIPVPPNGEAHTTMTNDGSTTSVSVTHNSSGDNSYSSLNVQVSSQGTASEEGN